MKGELKYYLVGVLLFGLTLSSSGQSATDNLTASIDILSSVTVESVQPLTFGTVVRSTTKEIDFEDGSVSTTESGGNTAITGGEQRGIFKVSTTTGANLSFRMEVPQKLTNTALDELDIDYSNYKDFTLDNNSTDSRAIQFNSGTTNAELYIGYAFEQSPTTITQFVPGGGFGNDGSNDGFGTIDFTSETKGANLQMTGPELYIFYGATITATSDQAIGDYDGDVTLRATVED